MRAIRTEAFGIQVIKADIRLYEDDNPMKTIPHVLVLFAIFFLPALSAGAVDSEGVRFFNGTWSEALKAAEASGKLIFVDVYTDWCPPCKRMDKEVLPLPEVGTAYNAAFINYKLDAEKGEGVALARQYEVTAYPTYLYLDAQGNLLHRAVGYFTPPKLLDHAQYALASANRTNNLRELSAVFDDGQRAPTFLRTYINKLSELGLDNSQALNAYFEKLPLDSLSQPEELMFIGDNINSTRSLALVFLLDHYGLLNEGQQHRQAPRLFGIITDGAAEAISEHRAFDAKQALTFSEQLLPYLGVRQQQRYLRLSMMHYVSVRDTAGVKRSGRALVGDIMAIPIDSVKAEDERRYRAFTDSFFSEVQDSASLEAFEAEKPYLINTYTRELSAFLYEAANAYEATLTDSDPALQEALAWMVRCNDLMPDERFATTADRIRTRIAMQFP